ncbi:unnamed protein product [Dicrocoelium dendriticum]|nr:unnamed protein product [Dicrocoelium dendriticum]
MEDENESIKKFCSVTNVSESEARHLLEAFAWNFDEAVAAHFDSEASPQPSRIVDDQLTGTAHNVTGTSSRSGPKIVTFDSLRSPDREDDSGQAFYVGGSETGGGGQQVLGPPKKNPNRPDPSHSPEDFVHSLFQAAKVRGAEVLDSTQYNQTYGKMKTCMPFTGTGHRLGERPSETSGTQPNVMVSCTSASTADKAEKETNVLVKMWRDGFSLDNGPLRAYTDPSSFSFLDDIRSGRVPQELVRSGQGGLINVLLEDHHHEEWHAPPPKVVPFSGKGNVLGHPVPRLVSELAPAQISEVISPLPDVQVDSSKPVTQLQIRLPDGGRLLVRLNHSHTISDIRQAIVCLCWMYRNQSGFR